MNKNRTWEQRIAAEIERRGYVSPAVARRALVGPPKGLVSVREVTVIEAVTVVGAGFEDSDPMRHVISYFTTEGEFLAFRDEWLEKQR